MNWQTFLKSRAATYVLGAVLVLVMIFAAKILIQKYRVDKEISQLQAEVDKVRKNNDQLSSMIKYFATAAYQEKAAREKLNLKKDGEFVVGLPNTSGNDTIAENNLSKTSNIKQWFNYFFTHE